MTPSGTATEFPIPTPGSAPSGIAPGPDGNLWYAELEPDKIGQVSTAGTTLTESSTPSSGVEPYGVTPGADGNVWFTELTGSAIGKLTLPNLNILNVYYIPNRFFIPNIAHLQNRGDTVRWLVLAPGTRGVIDTTGLNLYGSSPAGGPTATAIGGIVSFRFLWAGMYSYDDPFHTGSRGHVSVPIGVPRAPHTTGVANVTWASGDAPAVERLRGARQRRIRALAHRHDRARRLLRPRRPVLGGRRYLPVRGPPAQRLERRGVRILGRAQHLALLTIRKRVLQRRMVVVSIPQW